MGTLILMATQTGIVSFTNIDEEIKIYQDLSDDYLKLELIQIVIVYIFVLSKRPQDLFKSFNKRPDVQFSMFQYPIFFYAERKAALQRNTWYLKQKL